MRTKSCQARTARNATLPSTSTSIIGTSVWRAPGMTWLSGSLFGGVGRRRFLRALAAQDSEHSVVPLVARVLVNLVRHLRHREHSRPRSRERRRILDRKPIIDLVRAHPREMLDDAIRLTSRL